MKHSVPLLVTVAAFLLAALLVAPVSAVVSPTATTAATPRAYVSATLSSPTVTAGTPVTVSGIAPGAKEVQIWAFAGNYINVSTVPVGADGKYQKTYNTAGLPAATYYVFVQDPGADNKLAITLGTGYAGQVVNEKTGQTVFNFTGTGSVTDKAAEKALSDALSAPGIDDVYTKTQFAIVAGEAAAPTTAMMPGSDRDAHGCIGSAGYTWCEAKQKCLREWEEPCTAAAPATTAAPPAPAPTKSPLPALVTLTGILLGSAFVLCRKQL